MNAESSIAELREQVAVLTLLVQPTVKKASKEISLERLMEIKLLARGGPEAVRELAKRQMSDERAAVS